MGVAGSKFKRVIRNYNVENRAHKVISREKPIPAPQYKSVRRQVEAISKMNPDLKEMLNKKNVTLDNYLKDVFVKSYDEEKSQETNESTSGKPLPRLTRSYKEFEFGVYEPAEVRLGKCTIRQIFDILTKHRLNPTEYTAVDVVNEYKLDQKVAENILKYFAIHEVYIPKPNKEDKPAIDLSFLKKLGHPAQPKKAAKRRATSDIQSDGRDDWKSSPLIGCRSPL